MSLKVTILANRKVWVAPIAVRLGLRIVGKLAEADAARAVLARAEEPYRAIDDAWERAQVGPGGRSRLVTGPTSSTVEQRQAEI